MIREKTVCAAGHVAKRGAHTVKSFITVYAVSQQKFGVPLIYQEQKYRHQYIVSEALRLHRENSHSRETGLFINSAPRTKAHSNGQSFVRANFRENLVVVATPLSVLSGVRDAVEKLLECPNNQKNGLYDWKKEQHFKNLRDWQQPKQYQPQKDNLPFFQRPT